MPTAVTCCDFRIEAHKYRKQMTNTHAKGIPNWFLGPNGFLEAWGTKAQKPPIFRKIIICGPCRRRRQGQKATLLLKMCGFLALAPYASQKPLGQITTSGSLTYIMSRARAVRDRWPQHQALHTQVVRTGTQSASGIHFRTQRPVGTKTECGRIAGLTGPFEGGK